MMARSQIQAAQLPKGRSKSMALTIYMAFAGFGNMMSDVITASVSVLLLIGNKYRESVGTHYYIDDQQKHYP